MCLERQNKVEGSQAPAQPEESLWEKCFTALAVFPVSTASRICEFRSALKPREFSYGIFLSAERLTSRNIDVLACVQTFCTLNFAVAIAEGLFFLDLG